VIKADDFKMRCSAIGLYMAGTMGLTAPQEKKLYELRKREHNFQETGLKPMTENMAAELQKLQMAKDWPELPAGAKTACQNWLKEKLYDRRKAIESKYLDKGNMCEDASIEFLNTQMLTDYGKNEQYFENEFLTGTPDIVSDDLIIDMKNSWDAFTFPLFDYGVKERGYFYQLQGYMHLTNCFNSKLVYCLMSAPWELVKKEASRLAYKRNLPIEKTIVEIQEQMFYGTVKPELRIKQFDVKYDPEVIDEIMERVDHCRTYIKTLIEGLEK